MKPHKETYAWITTRLLELDVIIAAQSKVYDDKALVVTDADIALTSLGETRDTLEAEVDPDYTVEAFAWIDAEIARVTQIKADAVSLRDTALAARNAAQLEQGNLNACKPVLEDDMPHPVEV